MSALDTCLGRDSELQKEKCSNADLTIISAATVKYYAEIPL